MYSNAFCKVYNEFGWNYFPEAFGEQLLVWIQRNHVEVKTSLDLACGTGILCEVLHKTGIKASGMDFSDGMIEIAKENNPDIAYEVADMILYRPDRKFDLVTCTGDALNHIIDLKNVEKIFQNIYAYLSDGGYFIFDLLNEKEVSEDDEPFDLDFSDTIKAEFSVTKDKSNIITLKTTVYENGILSFEEKIIETVHDIRTICTMLEIAGFTILRCSDRLRDCGNPGTTCYIIAQK